MTSEMPGMLTILQGWGARGAAGAQQVSGVRVLGVTTVYAPNCSNYGRPANWVSNPKLGVCLNT